MKLGPVTKLDNRNGTTSKAFEDDMSAKSDVINIFRFMASIRFLKWQMAGVDFQLFVSFV